MTRSLFGISGPHADATLETGGAPAGGAKIAAVLVHGRGGTAEGIVRLADEFYQTGVVFLAPGAVGNSWFPARHTEPRSVNEPALSSAVECIAATIAVTREFGIAPERTVLIGISQGASVISEFLCRQPQRFGGAVIVSGSLPGETIVDRSVAGDLAGTPITVDSSEGDPAVPVDRVRATAQVLANGGGTVDTHIDDGAEHGLGERTIERIEQRFAELLDE